MGKLRTHKGFAKRVKVTATGKVLRKKAYGSHLMSSKSAKRRRKLRLTAVMTGAAGKTARYALGGRR